MGTHIIGDERNREEKPLWQAVRSSGLQLRSGVWTNRAWGQMAVTQITDISNGEVTQELLLETKGLE